MPVPWSSGLVWNRQGRAGRQGCGSCHPVRAGSVCGSWQVILCSCPRATAAQALRAAHMPARCWWQVCLSILAHQLPARGSAGAGCARLVRCSAGGAGAWRCDARQGPAQDARQHQQPYQGSQIHHTPPCAPGSACRVACSAGVAWRSGLVPPRASRYQGPVPRRWAAASSSLPLSGSHHQARSHCGLRS